MNSYFHKIYKFDIDQQRLYDEFINIATKHDMFERTRKFIEETNGMVIYKTYYRLRINYPSHYTSDIDPVIIQGYNKFARHIGDYSIDNIVDDFKETYTAEVAKTVYDYIIAHYPQYKMGSVKYHVLAPRSSLALHQDGTPLPRFFLSASVPEGAYMQIYDEKIPMHENGTLYKFICRALHNPLNESDRYRVSMVFTVEPK